MRGIKKISVLFSGYLFIPLVWKRQTLNGHKIPSVVQPSADTSCYRTEPELVRLLSRSREGSALIKMFELTISMLLIGKFLEILHSHWLRLSLNEASKMLQFTRPQDHRNSFSNKCTKEYYIPHCTAVCDWSFIANLTK